MIWWKYLKRVRRRDGFNWDYSGNQEKVRWIRSEGSCAIYRGIRQDNKRGQKGVLYIEADEDHVALQDGKKEMPRLVYIHEGRETKNGRNKLKNVYYETVKNFV